MTTIESRTRLARYATTAAGGLAAVAAPSADAGVITGASSNPGWSKTVTTTYGGPDRTISTFGPGASVLEGAGVDISFKMTVGGSLRNISFVGRDANDVDWITSGNNNSVSRLGAGAVIDDERSWNTTRNLGLLAFSTYSTFNNSGDAGGRGGWRLSNADGADSVRGYLGFRFLLGMTQMYGYFDVEVSRTGTGLSSDMTLTIHGWAYEAGSLTTPSAVPGGAGLAALAFGAAGLRGRRRG